MLNDADIYGPTTSRYYDRVYEQIRDPSGDIEFYRKPYVVGVWRVDL